MPEKPTPADIPSLAASIPLKALAAVRTTALHPHDSVATAGARMREHDASTWPVAEDHKLVGVIDMENPDWNIGRHGHDPKTSQVREIMNREPIFCHEDEDCTTAQQLMEEHDLCHLPVVDQQMRIVGIFSRDEIQEKADAVVVAKSGAPHSALPTRLKAGSPGLGEASQIEVEDRATELALIDGRETVSDADLAQAAAELAGGGTTTEAPEADPALEALTARDDPPPQTGHLVAAVPLQDEDNIAEQLIEDGLEEAEHDSRVVAENEKKYNGHRDA
ncbi:CBS domain-containing protein [Prosthecobacter sp.]|uniref:CBS domain-containing protein n=1 Tax=Prosthecobacter sp. TaxID=1965333 RepID=UPI002AB99532|nr:CBS domain-containing protein [Prosthecobacter sp.]MDZ4403972.1 CBS domain-containing protein [Prosthecobacter sp.]